MGCRISGLGSSREVSQETPMPPFRRRIDEFNKRNPNMTLSISQKELLMSGVMLDDIEAWTSSKSFSSSECSFKSPEKEDIWEEYDAEEDEVVASITIDKLVQEAERERKKDKEEEQGEGEIKPGRRFSDFDLRFSFHRSPSFRVYCRNSVDNDEDSEFSIASASEDGGEFVSVAQPDAELLNSSEGKRTRERRRDKCRRKLKGVIGKGRPVLHLLNVTSCYNQNSSKIEHRQMPEKAHSA